jgi:hypothetical protein
MSVRINVDWSSAGLHRRMESNRTPGMQAARISRGLSSAPSAEEEMDFYRRVAPSAGASSFSRLPGIADF